jgi:hypothetical protein
MFLTVKKSPLPLTLLLSCKVCTHFEPCNYSLNKVQRLQFTYLKQILKYRPVDAFIRFLYLRIRYICYRKRDRMLTHSHSATSLYNSANLSQSAISLHQLFTSWPHLTCEREAFGLVLFLPFSHFGFKNILILSCFHVQFYLHYYSEVIYQHGNLSSSGK